MQLTQRATRSAVGLLALLVGMMVALIPFAATSASAHDQLVSSNPESGQTLEAAPSEATLEFSGQIAELGSEVALMRDGEAVELPGSLQFDGTKITVPLPELEQGTYELNWRVVSSDGHPIAGTIPFKIGDSGADAGGGQGINNKPQDAADYDGDNGKASKEENSPLGMIALGIVGVAVIAMAAVLLVKRFANGNSPTGHSVGESSKSGSTAVTDEGSATDTPEKDA